MQQRMKNPAQILPQIVTGSKHLYPALGDSGVPWLTLHLVHLRVSQINGCSFCVDLGAQHAKQAGEDDQRLIAVAAWREMPCFTEAERAALALAECVTRLADREDPVPDAIWENATAHYDEKAMAGLLLYIALSNFYNRLNVPIRLTAGSPLPWS